jgi:hypothetical protein
LVQPGQHGFVVVIDLVTPYQGNAVPAMKWVKDTYIKNLNALKTKEAAANATYAVLFADVTLRQSVNENTAYKTKLQNRLVNWQNAANNAAATANPQPGAVANQFGAPVVAPPSGVAAGAVGALTDPNTQEDMSNDSFIEVTALVAIDPMPAGPGGGAAAPAPAQPGARLAPGQW